jgi:hypothetical protein
MLFRRHNRRAFLAASTASIAGISASSRPHPLLAQENWSGPHTSEGKAKSTILFFLCGGASHIDTWDMKPDAPIEYRGPFQPMATSASGIQLCEHLPMTAKQAHHLAIVRSVGGSVNTNDHHAGYYYQLTGHVPDPTFLSLGNDRTPYADDWPFIGAVVSSRRTPHPQLPNAITLPHKPSKLPYTRPGQFAAKLGVEHDPFYINGSLDQPLSFQAPSLVLEGDMNASRMQQRSNLLGTLDTSRKKFERYAESQQWRQHQKRGMDLLLSTQTLTAFDVASESEEMRQRYGQTVNGMSLLLARPFLLSPYFGKRTRSLPTSAKAKVAGIPMAITSTALKIFSSPNSTAATPRYSKISPIAVYWIRRWSWSPAKWEGNRKSAIHARAVKGALVEIIGPIH